MFLRIAVVLFFAFSWNPLVHSAAKKAGIAGVLKRQIAQMPGTKMAEKLRKMGYDEKAVADFMLSIDEIPDKALEAMLVGFKAPKSMAEFYMKHLSLGMASKSTHRIFWLLQMEGSKMNAQAQKLLFEPESLFSTLKATDRKRILKEMEEIKPGFEPKLEAEVFYKNLRENLKVMRRRGFDKINDLTALVFSRDVNLAKRLGMIADDTPADHATDVHYAIMGSKYFDANALSKQTDVNFEQFADDTFPPNLQGLVKGPSGNYDLPMTKVHFQNWIAVSDKVSGPAKTERTFKTYFKSFRQKCRGMRGECVDNQIQDDSMMSVIIEFGEEAGATFIKRFVD